jgi:hypothetical protein
MASFKIWVKAQKHDKMDGAEKVLSISQCLDDSCIQCNSIVRMIRIFSGTDMIKKVLICLFEVPMFVWKKMRCRFVLVPICLDTELSWCRTVFFNGCRNVLVPNCLVLLHFRPEHWLMSIVPPVMDILVDDIDRYEQLSNREELLTLTSALAGNGAEQDSSAPRHFGTR